MININISFQKIYLSFILNFFLILIFTNTVHSSEKIGTIVNLKNEVIAVNANGEKRTLDLYDEILLKDKVLTNELSTATIEFKDYSTIIVKESSSFEVTEFDTVGLKKIFTGIVDTGSVIIESGVIAKKKDGSMVIELPNMNLDVKGTRFNVIVQPDGTSEVSLAKDSFGNVGVINILSAGELKTLFNTEQVVSVNDATGISERPKTNDEIEELIEVSNNLVEINSIDQNVIETSLLETFVNGELEDVNGDGIIDEFDIEIIKENITFERQEKINFIADYSSAENAEFLSNILNFSDPESIGESMQMIFETNDDLISSVVTNLANEENIFLTTSDLEENNEIKEKIFTQMLNESDDGNNNIEIIGDIILKSDTESVGFMIETIQAVNEDIPDSTLALEVLSSMAESDEFNDIEFSDEGQDLFDEMMEEAVLSATDIEEGGAMLANVITNGNAESVSFIMDTIVEVADTVSESTLALEVLSSMAESDGFNDIEFSDEGQDLFDEMMEEAVLSAADSEEGGAMLANVITNGNAESVSFIMDTIVEVADTSENSTLALDVLSSMAESDGFNDIEFSDEGQDLFDEMMEEAVLSAADSEEGGAMLASIIANSDADVAETMFETISDISENNPNSTLAAEVLSSVVDTDIFTDTILDSDQMEQIFDLVDTIAYTNPADDTLDTDNDETYDADGFSIVPPYFHIDTGTIYNEEGFDRDGNFEDDAADSDSDAGSYDDDGFSMVPPYFHIDTGTIYNEEGFDRDGNSEDDAAGDDDSTYDDDGFSMVPPYFHRDTGTIYNMEGFDRDGNSEDSDDDESTFDDDGFSMVPPYYHRDTGTLYNPEGFDKDGNSEDEGEEEGGDITWNTTSSDFPTTLTLDDAISPISLSATGVGTISYTYAGALPDGIELTSGVVSGTPSTEQPATSVTFTATDEDGNDGDLVVSFPAVDASGGDGDNPTWITEPFFESEYELDDFIDLTAEAESSPAANGVEYSATGLPDGVTIDFDSGAISGTVEMVGNYSVIITATDLEDSTRSISTSSFSIDVIEYDEDGFNTSSPYYHRDTGTQYDPDGYNVYGFNSSGYNAANEYDPAYDEEASEA